MTATGCCGPTIPNQFQLDCFGATGDNVTDDYKPLQAAIDYVSSLGGGILWARKGATYKLGRGPIIKDGVSLELQGATLRMLLTGDGSLNNYGVRLRNRAAIANGNAIVESSGTVSDQAGIHTPIIVGPLNDDGGTVASPSPDEFVYGWRISNMSVATNRSGKVGIQIVGGANNGIIENITIPDSSVMAGGIHLDWGYIGTLFQTSNMPAARIEFDAGRFYTTHPNNIRIRNIRIGNMSRGSGIISPAEDTCSHGIRLSACHGISVENVTMEGTTFVGLRYTAGDPGYEFAPSGVKRFQHRGNAFRNVLNKNANNGWGVWSDSFADNVQLAIDEDGYTAMLPTISETDIVFQNVRTIGNGSANASDGFYFRYQSGGSITDCEATGHLNGALVGQRCNHLSIIRGFYHENYHHGVLLDNDTTGPADALIDGARCAGNGMDSGANYAGICAHRTARPVIRNCVLGHDGLAGYGKTEAAQRYGIKLTADAADCIVENNYVLATKSGGIAYPSGDGSVFTTLRRFTGNKCAVGVPTFYSGQPIIPYDHTITVAGKFIRHCVAAKDSLSGDVTPQGGAWETGETINFTNPASSGTGYKGSVCVTAGTPGTWKAFGLLV